MVTEINILMSEVIVMHRFAKKLLNFSMDSILNPEVNVRYFSHFNPSVKKRLFCFLWLLFYFTWFSFQFVLQWFPIVVTRSVLILSLLAAPWKISSGAFPCASAMLSYSILTTVTLLPQRAWLIGEWWALPWKEGRTFSVSSMEEKSLEELMYT